MSADKKTVHPVVNEAIERITRIESPIKFKPSIEYITRNALLYGGILVVFLIGLLLLDVVIESLTEKQGSSRYRRYGEVIQTEPVIACHDDIKCEGAGWS